MYTASGGLCGEDTNTASSQTIKAYFLFDKQKSKM